MCFELIFALFVLLCGTYKAQNRFRLMLLTITTTHKPATDLGYLLHKNPARLHSFELSFGQAHVFYPEANAERCTAALLLDVLWLMVALLPIKPFSAEKASQVWKMDLTETRKVLDELSGRAILVDVEHEGKTTYTLPPPMAGFFEFSMMRLRGDINQKVLGELFYQYLNVEEEFIRQLFVNGETQVGRVFVQFFDLQLGLWMGGPSTLCVFAETCGQGLALEHNGDLYACDHYVYPRYNLGNMWRTVNNPVLGIVVLQADFQHRFRYTLGKPDPKVGPDVWVIDYQEEARPAIVRGRSDLDLFAHGRVSIQAETGRIVKTEVLLDQPGLRARITTLFRFDDRFGAGHRRFFRALFLLAPIAPVGISKRVKKLF